MEYTAKLRDYGASDGRLDVAAMVEEARTLLPDNLNKDAYRLCYSCLDLTSLNETDNAASIKALVSKAVSFNDSFPGIRNVASICVYPAFVDTAGLGIGDSRMRITSVAGGFPASQTYLEVKMLEAAMAVENGADEIDIVMNVGLMLAGEYEELAGEIEIIRAEIGPDVLLKVIVESGALPSDRLVYKASLLGMLAGADFVKTSTGKTPVAATPEAAVVMCTAIRDYFEKTGRKVGFKAAGGVRSAADAALYYTIVKMVLGEQWLDPCLFRIGASSLANELLCEITGRETKYY